MESRRWILAIVVWALVLASAPAWTQEEAAGDTAGEAPEEESKELKFAGSPYIFSGPDTGAGAGFSIMYRDMFNKEGRDVTFSMSYTQNLYQDYSVEWQEPYFLSDDGRLKLRLAYSTRPAVRYFPPGNDVEQHGVSCNYSTTSYSLVPTYIYRFPKTDAGTVGMRLSWNFEYYDPDNGQFEDADSGSYGRPIRSVYPRLYRSDQFHPTWLMGPSVSLYHDGREDRFPLGGGREEVVWPIRGTYEEIGYTRMDESVGSTFSYNSFYVDLRGYFPVVSDDTIIAMRVKANINQGNIPFYKQPGFGGSSDLRGFFGGRFNDKNTAQFQVELRQGFFPDLEVPLLGGLIKAKYPSVVLFWDEGRVFDDYTTMGNDLLEEYHYAWGFGLRFVITPSVVIRVETGFSKEQQTTYLTAGLPF
jgi:outer membrane protein assembly factor BamA